MERFLVDTSLWIPALRKHGDETARARIRQLMADEAAVLCDVVRLELWNGMRGTAEREHLVELELVIPRVPISEAVWTAACANAARARASGLNIPTADHIVFACAKTHGLSLAHSDHHYDLLAALAKA